MNEFIEHEYPYPHPYYEEKTGRVNCQICGKSFVMITASHLRLHKITVKEYKLKFPDAPLTDEEFVVKALYGRDKNMFKAEETPFGENPPSEDIIGEEEIIDKSPDNTVLQIQEFKTTQSEKISDPVANMKKRIFNHLSMYLNNVRQNYFIEEKTLGGLIKFRYISDFADPVLKINVEFPDTFWHNQDVFEDPLREAKLKAGGWKVIKIHGASPSLKKIENSLK